MFERYTEKARRVIFFGRYEASQFGSPSIEAEHLLLGLFREDKALLQRVFAPPAPIDTIRKQIEAHTPPGKKISTSVDMPLSHQSKRALAFAAEEAERLNHKHIGTDHLLLGLLREENSFVALLLGERGVNLTRARVLMAETGGTPHDQRAKTTVREALVALLIARQKQGGVTIAERPTVGRQSPDFAVFVGEGAAFEGAILADESLANLIDDRSVGSPEAGGENTPPEHPAKLVREIQGRHARIRMLVRQMENAIANHEFEKARALSDQERLERELLRVESGQLAKDQQAPAAVPEPSAPPFLCIVMIGRKDSLAELRESIRDYIDEGVTYVWLIDSVSHRAYTGTRETGLRELKGMALRTANPVFELPLDAIFV